MKKYTLLQKVMALALTLVMVIGMVPATVLAVEEESVIRTADPSTINDWKPLFTEPAANGVSLSTENAGGIWTDKSVFEADSIPAELTSAVSKENTNVSITDEKDNFLVALSAIASNKEITGYSTIPTDTVFILDLSSSMQSNDDRGGSALDELVDATNRAIADLLALNKNNRVGVVLYAGNTSRQFNDNQGITTVLMPIDSYTTNRAGQYLETYDSDMGIRTHADLRNSVGARVTGELDSARGTFTQDGIYEGMKLLLGVTDTTVESGVQAGTDRLPIMVLMTDGEPTMANNDYNGNDQRTDLGTSNMYLRFNDQDYNHRYTIAFMNQLTAAFAKREVSQHYGTDALLYTLAYGEEVNRLDEALAVMNPSADDVLADFWTQFLAGEQVTVFTTRSGRPGRYTYEYLYAQNDTAEPLTAEDKLYVDDFFPAESDDDLFAAFQSIVDEIIIQSKYYPTYVEDDHDHDGYVTFADKIGGYMEVKDVKGIVIGDHYYSGATLAKGVVDGSVFGTVANPTEIGDNLIWSIKERLNITDTAVARQLLQNAYDYGQFSYTSDTEFSNYIGWYSDAEGNYLDFWYEGITTAAPADATHIIKSYLLLGETDAAHGIANTDMLYASIRVTKELNDADNDGITGETIVTWKVPASLIPTITYLVSVEVDSDGVITNVTDVTMESDQVMPIRLLYEVGLWEDIHDWNITEKVVDGYRDGSTDKDPGYVFYSNQWNKAGSEPERQTNRNTYSHFEPSVQNERYYYTEDTQVYVDQNGTKYTGDSAPSGTCYRAYQVFEIYNGKARMHTHYEEISSAALEKAEKKDGNWIIPKGTIHRYYNPYRFTKDPNTTDTMEYSFYPMIEVLENVHYYSAVTLGNNGKLTMTPATGIKVTKTVTETVDGASDTFTFVISGGSDTATLVRLDENGDEASRETLTFTNGEAEFTLKDGETVYIIDLEDGTEYTITEEANADYSVSEVKVNGQSITGIEAVVEAAEQTIQAVDFVNEPIKPGNLYITKEISSDHTVPDSILQQAFEVVLNVGTDLAGEEYDVVIQDVSGAETTTKVTVADNGTITLSLTARHTVKILGLPAGTEVTVTENLTAEQDGYFEDPTYRTRNHSGAEVNTNPTNTLVITGNQNATAVVMNTYVPKSTTVDLDIAGTKNFDAEGNQSVLPAGSFTFKVQRWNGQEWVDVDGMSAKVEYAATEDGTKTFSIENVLKDIEFTQVGTYAYQVVEVIGSVPNVTYDRTLYTFTVTVTDVNGQLVATVTDLNNTQITDGSYEVTFENTFHTATVSIDIEKQVNDPDISKAGFEFVAQTAVVDALGNWSVKPESDGGRTFSVFTDGAGEARMVDTYKDAGTYYYIISEANGGKNGWDYSGVQYHVTVVVTLDDATGDLTAVMTIEAVGGSAEEVATVTEDTNGKLIFKNTYDPADAEVPLGALVKKHLEGRDLLAGEFNFAIFKDGEAAFDADGKVTNISDAVATGTNDALGNVTFNPEKLTFDADGRYLFDVIEVKGDKGGVTYDPIIYDLVVVVTDNGNGQLEAAWFYEDATTAYVTFQNTYTAEPAQLDIPGEKTLTGRPIVNAEFRFTLTQVTDATGATKVLNGLQMSVENDPDTDGNGTTQFAFTDIEYTAEDAGKEFFYLIEEVNTGLEILGVTHNPDKVKFVVKVTVSDNGDGTLTATYAVVSGGEKIAFNNVYVPKGTSADLPGTKTLTGRVLGDGEFTFTLTEKTDNTYATDKENGVKQTVTNRADGTIAFEKLTFNATGDYYYVAEEVKESAPGVSYDSTKYYIHIVVTDDHKGQLHAVTHLQMVVSDSSGEVAVLPTGGILFNNAYAPADNMITISGTKKLEGGKKLEEDVFEVGLYDSEGELLQVAKIKADGTFTFQAIIYTSEDVGKTFTYTVKEIIPEGATDNGDGTWTKDQYIYDGAAFTVEVTVKDDVQDGQLEIVKTVTKSGAAAELTFTNTFVPNPIQHTLQAKKTYEKGLKGGDFEFKLVSIDGKTNVDQTKENAANGDIIFDPITFSAAGEYKFKLTEKKEGIFSFILPSAAEYEITITVVNENGILRISNVDVVNTKNTGESDLEFINTYVIDGEDEITLRGRKYLSGDRATVNEGEFEFGLYDAAGNLVEKVPVKADGTFAFSTLKFDETDVPVNGSKQITYTIREIPGDNGYVTYDPAVYTVVVTVKDDDKGGVEVSYTINDKAPTEIEIVFTNIFTKPAPALANIYIQKNVENKTQPGIGLDGFVFVLEQESGTTHEVISNADGKTGFQITFGYEDIGKTYTFKVYEKKGSTVGVTYDTTVYTIVVKVDVNPDGSIKTIINDVATNGIQLAFTNIYEKPLTPVTGDNFPIIMLGSLLVISGAAFVALMLTKKKKPGKYAR